MVFLLLFWLVEPAIGCSKQAAILPKLAKHEQIQFNVVVKQRQNVNIINPPLLKVWMFAPGQREKAKEILFDRDYEDAYSDPGSPAVRRTHRSTYVIARLEGTGQLILQGKSQTDLLASTTWA